MGYMGFLVVFAGAGIGGALRHAVNLGAVRLLGTGFPYGTLTVNVLGSFLMGVLAEYLAERNGVPPAIRLLLTTGMLGGFTTFSTFSLDTAALWESNRSLAAFGYTAVSVCASIAALFLGLALVRRW
jgi:fluoride exporter